jgi:hypothetical protein
MAGKTALGNNMAYYRVYLLNAADHIFFGQGIERDGDAAAVASAVVIANTAAVTLQYNAVEIWAGARRVAHLPTEEFVNNPQHSL